MRLIDLTTPLRHDPPRSLLERTDHARSAIERAPQYGVDPARFPTPGIHFASERVLARIHATATHVDAPWHYGPTSEGRAARTIDELPLEWFHGDGVVLDLSRQQDGGELTPDDIDRSLDGYALKAGDIVLIRTDLDKVDDPRKHLRLRQLGRPAAEHLLDRGIRVIGIDAVSPDLANADDLRAGKPDRHFPAHHLGREREYCIVELLTNLHLLPHHGFTVSLFPIKVERGSAGWCRAVAFVP